MERGISSIGAWMKLDKLKLNSDKTEIILGGTGPQLDKIRFDHLKVDDIEVPVQPFLCGIYVCGLIVYLCPHILIRFSSQFITIFIT